MFRLLSHRLMARPSQVLLCDAAGAAAGSAPSSTSASSGSRPRRNVGAQRKHTRALMLDSRPQVDIMKPNANKDEGCMMRFAYLGESVMMTRVAQSREKDAGEGPLFAGQRAFTRIPTLFIARMLAVLDESSPSCEILTNNTQGTLKRSENGAGVTLSCTTTLPTTGSAARVAPMNWSVDLDIAEVILLQRFLSQALHFNYGFYRTRVQDGETI